MLQKKQSVCSSFLTQEVLLIALIYVAFALWRVVLKQDVMEAVAPYTPVGAIGLCSGMYMRSRLKPFIFFFILMVVSDAFIMQFMYKKYQSGILYEGWWSNYLCLFSVVVVGQCFRGKNSLWGVVLGGLGASVIYFFASNAFVWYFGMNIVTGSPFDPSLSGLIDAYVLGLPFFRDFLIGTMVYGLLFVGVLHLYMAMKGKSSLSKEVLF